MTRGRPDSQWTFWAQILREEIHRKLRSNQGFIPKSTFQRDYRVFPNVVQPPVFSAHVVLEASPLNQGGHPQDIWDAQGMFLTF